jgi:hypothetical protein
MSSIWQSVPDKSTFEASLVFVVRNALIFNLQEQGHTFTGRLEKSIRVEIKYEGGDLLVEVYMESYGLIVDAGINPQNIPFGNSNGTAETSDFIQALYRYAIEKIGVGTEEALKVAFKIARAQKRDGNPTTGSLRFSKTGKRTGFIKTSLEDLQNNKIPAIIYQTIKETFSYLLLEVYSEKIKF